MEKKNTFSVIICSYNIENYIGRAIESVLQQDYKDYELIVVDDCSTDNTFSEISKYKDNGIKIYKTEHNTSTAAAARNIGVKKATGEYIIYLDGDDTLFDTSTLSKINNIIGTDNPDIVFLGYQDVGGYNKTYISNEENSKKEARIACDVMFSVSSKCWNRKFLLENNITFEEGRFYEDMDYSIRSVILAQNLKYGEIPIFKYYRNRKGSVMSTPSIKRIADMYKMMASVIELYSITPEEYKKYLLSFIKNETESLPIRMSIIIDCLKNGTGSPVLPKRNYPLKELNNESKN